MFVMRRWDVIPSVYVGVRFGVEKGNVAVGEMVLVENGTKVVVVLNDVVSVAKSENEICVHGDGVEGA